MILLSDYTRDYTHFFGKNKNPENPLFTRFPRLLKAGDERIESLRILEFPCIYAGLQDFQLAFSGSEMAISGS